MIARRSELEKRVSLGGVTWATYQAPRSADENRNLPMTYDHGALEIVSPSRKHEQVSYLIGRMIDEWTLRHGIDVWHWKFDVLEALRLNERGQYQACQGSVELPRFPFSVAAKLVADRMGKSDTAVIQRFVRAIKPRPRK